nr:hypothetical protein CFP56_24718 [Quercus suber]
MDEDELQFGPWMRVIAPKIKQRKGSPSQSRFSDVDVEENQVIDGEEEGTGQPIINLQPPPLPVTSEADTDTAKQLPEKPRQLRDLSKPIFIDPIQFSSFECDGGVSESVTPKNKEFPSLSKSKSPRNQQVSILSNLEGSKEEKFARDYISSRTLLNDGKSDKDPSQNMEQPLTANIPNGGPTVIKGSTLANVANENSNEESLKADEEMECISNFDEDIPGKK